MQYHPKLVDVDEDEDVVVVVEEILDTMVIMIIIPQILKKGKPHCTTRKWNNTEAKQENWKFLQDKPPKNRENNCYRCGMKGHWSHTCRTPKHLVDLYQASIKAKRKEIEMNFTNGDGLDLTYYDIDFFGGPSEKTDHLINGEKINID